jgi:hypothetical protein
VQPLSEAPLIALTLVVLIGAVLLGRARWRLGGAVFAGGLLAGFFVRESQFAVTALAIGVAALLTAWRRPAERTPLLGLAAAALAGGLAQFAAAARLGWPGVMTSLQDLVTNHFTTPDVAHPVPGLIRLDLHYWAWWLIGQATAPVLLISWGLAAWVLARRSTPFGLVILATALTGLVNQAAHPVTSQGDRLYVMMWLAVVVAGPVLLESARSRRDPVAPVAQRTEARQPVAASV